jgi:hypothetical protein
MNEKDIFALLEQLTEVRGAIAKINQEWERMTTEVITPEIQAQLDAIDMELEPQLRAAQSKATELETAVKAATLELGRTVRGTFLQAVWNKGRTSWATKSLEGYATVHPEILQFKNEGDPYVSIRGS